jgi:hypothetical protein
VEAYDWVLNPQKATSQAMLQRRVHCILLANICIGVDAAAVEFVSSTYELHALPVALLQSSFIWRSSVRLVRGVNYFY